GVFHGLLVQDARERTHLVARRGGFLEAQFARSLQHALLDLAHDFARFAIEKARCALDVARVLVGLRGAHAGSRTAADLVQQTGPRPVGEHRVFTGAQAEYFLQDLYGFAHGPRIGKRPEKLAALIGGDAVIGDARPLVAGDPQVRV